MANYNESSGVRNLTYMGKHSLLPPKSPFPSTATFYADYAPGPATGFIGGQKPRDSSTLHQRTSSESQIIEEQPSWLDELLDEPESPVQKGCHRRSSSDSLAYVDAYNAANMDYLVQDEYSYNKALASVPSWGSRDYVQPAHFNKELNSFRNQISPLSRLPGSSCIPQEGDGAVPSSATVWNDQVDSSASSERKDCSAKSSASEADTKRAKQQFAQRSRVRKLQYIAELERNVQALQAGGSEVSAELEFVNQQHLILSMENKALKQRLENLAQEHLIKYMEHEVLEREIGRLRALHQQQQLLPQQQKLSFGHRRSKSSNLDSQFANLSLKQHQHEYDHHTLPGG